MSSSITVNGNTYVWPDQFLNYQYVTTWPAFISDCIAQFVTYVSSAGASAAIASAAAVTATNSAATQGTSTTSLTIGLGTQTLTVQTEKGFIAGMPVRIAKNDGSANWMDGTVTSYTSGTGVLVINATSVAGSGTFAAWNAFAEGPQFATSGTSTTSLTIGTGTQTLTVQTGLGFAAGMPVRIAKNDGSANWMDGTVTTYVSSSGSLTVNVQSSIGAGTISAWNVFLEGAQLATAGTSTTSLTVGTGTQTLTVQTGLGFLSGMPIRIAKNDGSANWMDGIVTSYTSTTGSLVVNVRAVLGSGTISAWNVFVTGTQATTGVTVVGDIAAFSDTIGTQTDSGISTRNIVNTPVRNTVLSGVNSGGVPAFITTGSGLRPGLLATASPLTISFADGFGSLGAIDHIEQVSADSSTFFPAVPASNSSFLSVIRSSPGAVVGGSTLAPPQFEAIYPRGRQSCLPLNNTLIDAFGNTWGNSGAGFSNVSPNIPGTYMATFTAGQNISCSGITSLGGNGWTIRAKAKFPSLPTAGNFYCLFSAVNAGGYGLLFGINNVAGTIRFVIFASSNGTSWNLASAYAGSLTPSTNTAYDIEITDDTVGGSLRTYINGTADAGVTRGTIGAFTQFFVGAGNGAGANPTTGSLQALEIMPYCLHPGGVTFTPPTTLPDITVVGYASDWFDTLNYHMNSITGPSTVAGTDPVFVSSVKTYVGEVSTGATTVSSMVNYAFEGKYDSGLFPVTTGTSYAKSHNIGVNCDISVTAAPSPSGQNEKPGYSFTFDGANNIGWIPAAGSRNSVTVQTAGTAVDVFSGTLTTSAYYRIRAERGF